ncbi:MAG TPA: hypothetical protein VK817_27220 [Trebonia sp.]|jgi:hypothetical protein|nr:hypothetical protein [Trebonia sp.]
MATAVGAVLAAALYDSPAYASTAHPPTAHASQDASQEQPVFV